MNYEVESMHRCLLKISRFPEYGKSIYFHSTFEDIILYYKCEVTSGQVKG